MSQRELVRLYTSKYNLKPTHVTNFPNKGQQSQIEVTIV